MRRKLTAILALAAFTQTACYNSYFIDKTELEKLESSVEPQEVVTVYGDCPSVASTASIYELGPLYAQAEETPPPADSVDEDVMSEIEDITGETQTTDAPPTDKPADKPSDKAPAGEKAPAAAADRPGCKRVEVSTANSIQLVTDQGRERVTPFNFMMSGGQLVSPEYDLLLRLDQVEGARVREFSAFKTVTTIVLVSAVAVGTFVGISILAPDSGGFQP